MKTFTAVLQDEHIRLVGYCGNRETIAIGHGPKAAVAAFAECSRGFNADGIRSWTPSSLSIRDHDTLQNSIE